ncbi:MAG: hypothetical protein N2044_04175 [Cyclobacteriaceae bacterium]|nr:hypothetical protein [Cyclobacteriaceae bacterium]
MLLKVALPVVLLWIWSCSRQTSQKEEIKEQPVTDSVKLAAPPANVSFEVLYGIYQHENNRTGSYSELEISPMGNDLQFLLTLNQHGCNWQLQGTLAMMYHLENEYAGFYDSETCRLVFTFFIPLQQIKIEEAGICIALPPRCSVGGIYQKENPR